MHGVSWPRSVVLMRPLPLSLALDVGQVLAHQSTFDQKVTPLLSLRVMQCRWAPLIGQLTYTLTSLVDLCSSSNEDEGALPHWSTLMYVGFVEAPVDKPPFQLYCLLLMLPYDHAIHFEYKCCSCLGV